VRLLRTNRRVHHVAAIAATIAIASAAVLIPAQPASAAFAQETYQCWPGPSGNACARLFYDPSTRTWRAYGAVDPNTGKSIVLREVALVHCERPDSGCSLVSRKGGSGPGNVYQRITTDGKGPGCYWYSNIYYTVGTTPYFRSSPIGGLC
jgi:hypothetical protein